MEIIPKRYSFMQGALYFRTNTTYELKIVFNILKSSVKVFLTKRL